MTRPQECLRPNPAVRPAAKVLEPKPSSSWMSLHRRVDLLGHGRGLEEEVGLILEEQFGVLALRVPVRLLLNSEQSP